MSYRTLTTKNSLNASMQVLLKRGAHVAVGIGAFAPVLALANPTGGQVVAGTATIKNPNANTTVVKQSSASAIIDWQQFNIGKGQFVQFLQPSSSSVILNRVIGGGGSSIFGSLTGNGQVFLVNTNGVFFGKGASIDAQGFLASTLDIADSDFLSGHYLFDKNGGDATIVNQGSITAHKGGYVVLAGDYAENDGLISAQSGHIVLASGSKSTLTLNGNSLVSYAVNQATLANLAGANNAGKLQADGGTVIMTADVANLLKATVVNNTGLIEAHAISKNGGTIQLLATGGNIVNAGTLDASATHAGQQGGTITLKGDGRTTLTSASKIFATGDGANGGHVEVSGNTIAMRGAMNLGRGGNLLLDPNQVTIVAGNGNSGVSLGTGSGENAAVGVGFIQTQLNNNTNVDISAHEFIHASSAVKTIKATGTGSLNLHAGSVEAGIDLKGVDVTIGGKFKADFGYGSFGHITAKSIDLISHNPGGSMSVAGATATTSSLKTTSGSITITGELSARSSGSLKMQAGSDIIVHGAIHNTGNVNLVASGEGIEADVITSNKDISIKASVLVTNSGHAFLASAEGNLSLKGLIGSASNKVDHNVTLKSGGVITLDHGIVLTSGNAHIHNLDIQGKSLAYTGAGAFVLSAGYGTLILDAAIGTAKAPVKYDVKLFGGFGVHVQSSVITGGTISASQLNFSSVAGASSGLFVGGSDAMTLSAKGPIRLQGGNRAFIGGDGAVIISADDGKPTTTDDLTINAKTISVAGNSAGTNVSYGAVVVDHSVTLHAGHDVIIGASTNLDIGGHSANASVRDSGVAATVKNDVTITAGDDINLTGHNIFVRGGRTFAGVQSDVKATVTATAEANVSLNAGHDVNINANNSGGTADVSGGYAFVQDLTGAVKQSATANASATLSIKAGHNVSIAGHTVRVLAGESAGRSASIVAGQSGAKANATAHADISITAGNAITLTGQHQVEVSAGYGVAAAGFTSGGTSCSGACTGFAVKRPPSRVSAIGENGTANLTATANVSLSAGAGGITLTGGSGGVNISAGYGVANGASVDAGSLGGGKAALDAESKVTFLTASGGDVTITGKNIGVHGGGRTGGQAIGFISGSNSGGPFSELLTTNTQVHAAAGETATYKADTSITIKSAGDVRLSASAGGVSVSAGYGAAEHMSITAIGTKAVASATVNTGVSVTAATGVMTFKATGGQLDLAAGPGNSSTGAGRHASISASFGGKAGLTVDTSETFTAHGAVSLTATGGIGVSGGNHALYSDHVNATSSAALATATANTSLTLNAGGAFTASASGGLEMSAGEEAGSEARIKAIGTSAKASVSADSRLVINAGGAVTLKGSFIDLSAGNDAGGDAVLSGSAGGAASLIAKSAATVTGGGTLTATATAGGIEISAGDFAAGEDDLKATQGTATLLGDGSVTITTKGAVTLTATGNIELQGSDETAYDGSMQAFRGTATETGLGGVTLKAGGSLTATAGGAIEFSASESAAKDAVVKAIGNGAKATLTADDSVNVSATNITLSGSQVFFQGSNAIADAAVITGSSGGVAAVTARGKVSVITGGDLTATATTGVLEFSGGDENGSEAKLTANQGTATLVADGGVLVSAKGNMTLKAKTFVGIEGSDDAASNASLHATRGIATLSAFGNVILTAGKAFLASASNGGMDVSGSEGVVRSVDVEAHGTGAKATVLGDTSVSITAGTTLTLKAHTTLDVSGGTEENGYEAFLEASSGGIVSVTGRDTATLTAGGNVLISAAVNGLTLNGGESAGRSASIIANHGTASLNVDSSVTVNAKGTLTLKAGKTLEISGSDDIGSEASIKANHGTATLTALSNITLTAGGAFLASAGSWMEMSGGEDVADDMSISAKGAATKVSVDAESRVLIKSGGAVTLKAHKFLEINGSDFAAGGNTINASSGAAVNITGLANVDITAGGAFLASALTSFMEVDAGDEPGERNIAIVNHGSLSINANTGVHIKAATTLNLKAAGFGEVSGSDDAASDNKFTAIRGTITDTAFADVTLIAGGNVGLSFAGSFADVSAGDDAAEENTLVAKGTGSKITMFGDTSVTISGKDVVVKSTGGTLDLSGSEDAAEDNTITASSGAVIGVTGLSNLNITAKGKFSASAANAGLNIEGGEDVASDNRITATGAATKVNLLGQANVNITAAGAVTLKGKSHVEISGSADVAEDIHLTADSGAVVTNAGQGAVNITAGGNFIASASNGFMIISGGNFAGGDLVASAFRGTGTVTADSGVHIKVHGNTTLTAKTNLGIFGGTEAASAASAVASNGKITDTASGLVSLVTSGTFTASAATGALTIQGGNRAAFGAFASADAHGAATLTGSGSVAIAAGGAMNFKAGTTLKVSAAERVLGGNSPGSAVVAKGFGSGAVASVTGAGGITLKGSSLSLTAVGALSINSVGTPNHSGAFGVADFAKGSAGSHGVAKLSAKDSINIVTGGAFKAKAGGVLNVHTGKEDMVGAHATDSGAGADVSLTADDTVNIAAQSIALSGSGNLFVFGGQSDAFGASMHAADKATATMTLKNGLNLTASKSITATLLGTASHHELSFFVSRNTAKGMLVAASSGGVATANVDDSVNVKVTGAGGSITLKTGANQTHAGLSIFGGSDVASSAHISADSAKATLNATGTVNLAATGTITLAASHGGLSIFAGDSDARDAHATADGKGAVATLNANNSANIKGGNLVFTGSTSVQIYGDFRGMAQSLHLINEHGGKAAMNLDGRANVTATGNITMTAGTELFVYAGSNSGAAKNVLISGSLGSAVLASRNDADLTAGGNIKLTAGTGLFIYGTADNLGRSDHITEVRGDADVTLSGDVNIKAGKAFTASAGVGSSLSIHGGESVMAKAHITAEAKNSVTVDAHATVNITAGTSVNLKAADGLEIYGSRDAGLSDQVIGLISGAKATATVQSTVNIKSGTDINLAAGSGNLIISGGDRAGSHAVVAGEAGTATQTIDAGVSLAAKGKLTMTLAGTDLDINGGSVGGKHATAEGIDATGKATLTIDQSVSLTAGGAFKETGALNVKLIAGIFAATGTDAGIGLISGGKATASVDSGITLKGSTLSVAHTNAPVLTSATGLNVGGLLEKGKITIVGGHISGLFPLGGSSVTIGSAAGVLGLGGGVNLFGAGAGLTITAGTTISLAGGSIAGSGAVHQTSAPPKLLGTVVGDGIVFDLMPVLTVDQPRIAKAFTDFTPSHSASYQGGAACMVTLTHDNGGSCRIR